MARWGRWCSATNSPRNNTAARASRRIRRNISRAISSCSSSPSRRSSKRSTPNISKPARTSLKQTPSAPPPSASTISCFPGEPENGRKDAAFFERVVEDPELGALVQEMNVAAAKVARTAADRVGGQDRHAAFRRRFVRPASGHRFPLARCERSEFSRRDVRSNPARLWRTGARADRGRRRRPARRNDLRHPERQGGDLRDSRKLSNR